MTVPQLLKLRRKDILAIAARHGATSIRVFGSAARGEATPHSDVDFLVELEPGRTLLDLGGLLMDLRDLLNMPVDVVTPNSLNARFRQQVLDEAESL
ncbi:MAG: nucleotidyltransferase family protein [Chloroflexi bacterium]|nr:nucleotidyltransferase family protein [Chloroflexota bacterium]